MDGVRLASWELRQADIDHKVIPDTAVAWLFEREPIDVVLVDADWVAANGDTGAVIGSRAVALQAAATPRRPGRHRPMVVVAASATPSTRPRLTVTPSPWRCDRRATRPPT